MARLIDMTLEDLYKRPKITPATFKAIASKEDFSVLQPHYCDKVCSAPCYIKDPSGVILHHAPVDIMVVQHYPSMDDRFKPGERLDSTYMTIFNFLMRRLTANRKIPGRLTNTGVSWRLHHALKCRPFASNREDREGIPFGDPMPLPNNPSITPTTINKCAPYLLEEIRQCKPKVIVSTCTPATKALGFKHRSNYKNRGAVDFIEVDGRTIPVIFTLHPEVTTMIRQNSSGQMWGPDYLTVIARDLEKAVDIVCNSIKLKSLKQAVKDVQDNGQIAIATSMKDVKMWHQKLKSLSGTRALLSWDTETDRLDCFQEGAKFLSHQFGYRRKDGKVQAVVFPLWHRDNDYFDPDEAWTYVADLLLDPGLLKVAHNAAFDLKFTRVTTGVEVEGLIADTMLLLHAINSGITGNYGLKMAVWDFLLSSGLGGYEDQLGEEVDVEEAQSNTG